LPTAEDVSAALARYEGDRPPVSVGLTVAVFFTIGGHFDPAGRGWCQETAVASTLGTSPPQVRRAVRWLRLAECLTPDGIHARSGHKVANLYRLGPALDPAHRASTRGDYRASTRGDYRAPTRPRAVTNEQSPMSTSPGHVSRVVADGASDRLSKTSPKGKTPQTPLARRKSWVEMTDDDLDAVWPSLSDGERNEATWARRQHEVNLRLRGHGRLAHPPAGARREFCVSGRCRIICRPENA
jgi:hypothetical protein